MNVVYAGPIATTIESVGFLMTLSLVICFFIVVGCLCLRMYECLFPKQNFEKQGMDQVSLNTLGRTLRSSSNKF
jgi:hypothetical protein